MFASATMVRCSMLLGVNTHTHKTETISSLSSIISWKASSTDIFSLIQAEYGMLSGTPVVFLMPISRAHNHKVYGVFDLWYFERESIQRKLSISLSERVDLFCN